jgi:hypothetical protein
MIGDIALYQGKPVSPYAHGGWDFRWDNTWRRHVLDAYVSPTLEVMVILDPKAMKEAA